MCAWCSVCGWGVCVWCVSVCMWGVCVVCMCAGAVALGESVGTGDCQGAAPPSVPCTLLGYELVKGSTLDWVSVTYALPFPPVVRHSAGAQ